MPRTVLALSILALASCAHPDRVSRGPLRQLARKHETYVLVFGSLSMPDDSTTHPTIRFVHQSNRAAPEYLLHEVTVGGNHRFYAILNKPAALAALDEFEAAVGSRDTAWDKITYVRLQPGDGLLAFYVGEITVTRPPARNVPGQTMTVAIRYDFQNAAQELRRLYPEFSGAITKAPLLRAPVPVPAPPPGGRSSRRFGYPAARGEEFSDPASKVRRAAYCRSASCPVAHGAFNTVFKKDPQIERRHGPLMI